MAMEEIQELKGFQRAALMKAAHHLNPNAVVGRNGLTDEVRTHIDRELQQHELIKVRFVAHKDDVASITRQAAAELGAIVVATIGHVAILFRPAEQESDRRVVLPERRR